VIGPSWAAATGVTGAAHCGSPSAASGGGSWGKPGFPHVYGQVGSVEVPQEAFLAVLKLDGGGGKK
jgi:hypothetical protein